MKPRMSEDFVDRTIGLGGWHMSAQHKKGQRSVGLGLGYGFHMRLSRLCTYSTYLCGQYQQYISNQV